MDKFTQEVLFALMFFTFLTTVGLTVARYVYLIRKAMIEYGIEEGSTGKKRKRLQVVGILLGLGTGLFLSAVISLLDLTEDTTDLLAWGSIIWCTGLGLLATTLITERRGW